MSKIVRFSGHFGTSELLITNNSLLPSFPSKSTAKLLQLFHIKKRKITKPSKKT